MKKYQTLLKGTVCASLFCCAIPAAQANNWFDLQTVAFPSWGAGRFIGFVQPVFTNISASPAANHLIPRPDYVGETDSTGTGSTSSTYIQRARFLVRGSINPNISYYLGSEAGDNGYDYSFGNYAPRIIDANLTFSNMLPLGNRFEVGVIRAPGPEDAMQGFMVFNFLDLFTSATAQLMQPVFYQAGMHYTSNGTPGGYQVASNYLSGNNGFRYPGVQLENWFMVSPKTEIAYGAMLGEYGRQFETGTDNGQIYAGRIQASYLLSPHSDRIFRDDITGYVWYQEANPQMNGLSNQMIRDGFGMTARKGYMRPNALSAKFEYISGTGNIMAPAAFDQVPGVAPAQYDATFYPGSQNRAYGYDASVGYFFTKNIEAVLRYDWYDRLPNIAVQERVFENRAISLQYHITGWTRIVVDYIDRSLNVPNPLAILKANGQAGLNLAETTGNAIGNQFDLYAIIAF